MAILLTACGSASSGSGSSAGSGGGGEPPPPPPPPPPASAPRDVYFADVRTMMGNGDFMADVDIGWTDPNAASSPAVTYRLSRSDGSMLDQGTTGAIPAGGMVTVQVMADGLADGEMITLAIDPDGVIVEDVEHNNERPFTAMVAEPPPPPPPPPPGTTAVVDLQFNDSHYHQAYYYNNLAFHFLVQNPNSQGVGSGACHYTILDGDTQIWRGSITNVPAPNDADRAANRIPTYDVFVGDGTIRDPADATRPYRPTPGRHVYTIRLDSDGVVAETNEANNLRRIVIDIPANQVMAATPQLKPDVRLQDPHVHQFWNSVVFHFFVYNFHGSETLASVGWRVVRVSDGFVVNQGVVENLAPRGTAAGAPQVAFRYTEEFKGPDVEYLLILDPDNLIDEDNETNNQVKFIIDWSQPGVG
ncbi:MAG: hypothetical protein H0W72_00920 [Planctomycetes bacterium]|nr:hypothetical protein [Planctomycetota bacterium]